SMNPEIIHPMDGPGGDGFCEYSDVSCGNLKRYGGQVMHNPKVLLDFWGGPNCNNACFDNPTIDPNAVNPSDDRYVYLVSRFVGDLCLGDYTVGLMGII